MVGKDMTIESAVTKNTIDDPALKAPLESLKAARELRQMRREHGIDYIHLVVDDVEGDWLEQWGEDEVLDSEEFQEKLDFLVAIARREEFQKDIQKIEEKISEADREIQDFKAKFINKIQRAYQDLPVAIPSQLSFGESSENLPELPLSLAKDIEVIKSLSDLVAFQPTAEDYFRLGNAHFLEGRYEDAITNYTKAIELDSYNPTVLNNRGFSLNKLGRDEEAFADYDKAIELNPDYAIALNNRGVSLSRLERYEEALTDYNKAIELNPDHLAALNNRGVSLSRLGRYEEALTDYDKIIELNSSCSEAEWNRGRLLDKLGRHQEAIAIYDKALELEPSNYTLLNNRGVSLHNLGRFEEAITSYDKAIEIQPENGVAWFNKACVYALQSDLYRTIENLMKAIKLNPIYLKQTKVDPSFDLVRNDEKFKKTFGE
jgi:tetratricopeptide (TPR) repeat protein